MSFAEATLFLESRQWRTSKEIRNTMRAARATVTAKKEKAERHAQRKQARIDEGTYDTGEGITDSSGVDERR